MRHYGSLEEVITATHCTPEIRIREFQDGIGYLDKMFNIISYYIHSLGI